MPLREKFGRRLKAIRLQKGLTQEDLAEELGLSVEAISNMERGVHAPSFDTLESMADVLGVPVREFFSFPE